MKKQERHQIKRDDLATFLESAADFAEANLRQVLTVGALVVVVLLGSFGARTWLRSREARNARLLGELIATYNAPVTATLEDLSASTAGTPTFTSAEERDRKVLEVAEAILKAGGSGQAVSGALLYKGMAQANLKQYEEAARPLDDVVRRDPGGLFGALARLRLAEGKEAQGKPEEAMALYQAIADDTRGVLPPEQGLMGVARCQEALGRKDEALKMYRLILSEYPDSEYVAEARTRVSDLS